MALTMFCSNCGAGADAAANFCSNCGSKLAARKPAAAPPSDAPAAKESPLPSLGLSLGGEADTPQPVKVLDAAGKLLLSGSRAEDVQKSLDGYLRQGAKLVTAVCQIGKAWTAVCTVPPKSEGVDQTQSLSLADLDAAQKKKTGDQPPDDGCRVEELGFKRIVYGPSQRAVKLRVDFLKQYGAEMVSEIEEIDGEWTVVLDLGDARNTGYRW